MVLAKERQSAIWTLHGWAISLLLGTGAIRECEYHGWMQDRADPHARDRAFEIACQELRWAFHPRPPPALLPTCWTRLETPAQTAQCRTKH